MFEFGFVLIDTTSGRDTESESAVASLYLERDKYRNTSLFAMVCVYKLRFDQGDKKAKILKM